MTTPQEMEEMSAESNWLYRFMTKIIAWLIFTLTFSICAGTIVFIALALYRGILWLWPGGAQ